MKIKCGMKPWEVMRAYEEGAKIAVRVRHHPFWRCTGSGIPAWDWAAFEYAVIYEEPYADFKIDEPVMVRSCETGWCMENFAGVSDEGKPMTWAFGTRWASEGNTYEWEECRRPTSEELSCLHES